jgi:hypothetical protein
MLGAPRRISDAAPRRARALDQRDRADSRRGEMQRLQRPRGAAADDGDAGQ